MFGGSLPPPVHLDSLLLLLFPFLTRPQPETLVSTFQSAPPESPPFQVEAHRPHRDSARCSQSPLSSLPSGAGAPENPRKVLFSVVLRAIPFPRRSLVPRLPPSVPPPCPPSPLARDHWYVPECISPFPSFFLSGLKPLSLPRRPLQMPYFSLSFP